MRDPETLEVPREARKSQAPARAVSRETGEVVGSYRILGVLGEGAVGRVFLAEHVRLGRKVALKMLREEHASNPTTVQRFFGEAKAVNQISHENIVAITDFVEEPGGSYYIMELLEGETLARTLAENRLATDRIIEIASQIAGALEAVHQEGIVHRDLKPANIFLTAPDGRVKLLDFGVAKLTERIAGMRAVETAAGVIVGTASYMSPEQASASPVDHRTDIYALGVILYEMLTGTNPFQSPNFLESLVAQAKVTPPPPSLTEHRVAQIPESLEALVMDCLAKSPEARPQSMRDVRARLQEVLAELGRAPDPPPARKRWIVRSIVLLAAALAAIALLAGRLLDSTPEVAEIAAPAPLVSHAVADPPPAPPPKKEIALEIDSSPRSARATLVDPNGVRRAIGRTPLTHRMPASEAEHQLELQLANHQRSLQKIVPAKDLRILVHLERERPRIKRPPRGPKRAPKPAVAHDEPLDRNGVLDPFD